MTRIKADQIVYFAVGVPDSDRDKWAVEARHTLEKRGFAAIEMAPPEIVAQAEHIKNVYRELDLTKGAET